MEKPNGTIGYVDIIASESSIWKLSPRSMTRCQVEWIAPACRCRFSTACQPNRSRAPDHPPGRPAPIRKSSPDGGIDATADSRTGHGPPQRCADGPVVLHTGLLPTISTTWTPCAEDCGFLELPHLNAYARGRTLAEACLRRPLPRAKHRSPVALGPRPPGHRARRGRSGAGPCVTAPCSAARISRSGRIPWSQGSAR